MHGVRGVLTIALLSAREFLPGLLFVAGLLRLSEPPTLPVWSNEYSMLTHLKSLTSWGRCEITVSGLILHSGANWKKGRMIHARNFMPALPLLPVDASQVDYLFNRLIKATPSELPVLRDALKTHRTTLTPKLWTVLESAKPGDASLLPSASALAGYDPDDAKWEAVGGKVAQALVSVNPDLSRPLARSPASRPGKLTSPLAAIFRDKSRPEIGTRLATNILTDYASDDPELIADLLDGRRPLKRMGVLSHRPAAGVKDLAVVSGGDRQEGDDT